MFEQAHSQGDLSRDLYTLPNETLIRIASLLSIPDLLSLSKSNRKLYVFAQNYLYKYQYVAQIWKIPNEIVCEVLDHLDSQKDKCHFAQSSRRLYPIITDHIYRHNIKCEKSSLLNYAAKKNLRRMTRRLLLLNADLETRSIIHQRDGTTRLTPLGTAARYGHAKTVHLLLENGAIHVKKGARIPLVLAMLHGHEPVALLLSRDLDASVTCFENGTVTLLQMASMFKMKRLVTHLLGRKSSLAQRNLDDKTVHNLCNALVRVLLIDVSEGNLVERKVDEDAYQVVMILLRAGASPDVRIEMRSSQVITARVFASRHPDPRIRNLLATTMSPLELGAIRPVVGRPWKMSLGDEDLSASEIRAHTPSLTRILSQGFLGMGKILKSGALNLLAADMNMAKVLNREHIGIPLNAEDIAATVRRENCRSKERLALPPLELNTEYYFPQLVCSTSNTQKVSREFWEERPAMNLTPISRTGMASPASRNTKVEQNDSQVEEFPQLMGSSVILDDTSKDIWATFTKCEGSQDAGGSQRAPSNDKNQTTRQPKTSRKQKKWVPLVLCDAR